MFRYLGLKSAYPEVIATVNTLLYHGLIGLAVITAMILVGRRLAVIGYNKVQIAVILLFTGLVAFPAGFTASRAAAMFYRPMSAWSLEAFFEYAVSGGSHTFHASIIVPIILMIAFFAAMRYRPVEIMDAVMLYVPLAHIIGRTGCLLIGCCWGRYVHLGFFGFYLGRFVNPVPLYSILINIGIFLMLRRIYENIYQGSVSARNYAGTVLCSYLLIYGAVRMTLEIFRTTRNIFFGLTQAQMVMAGFILIGGAFLIFIAWRNRKPVEQTDASERDLRKMLSLLGLLAACLTVIAGTFYLKDINVLPWPISYAVDLQSAFMAIWYYLPFLFFPVLSFFWLRAAGIPVGEAFRWNRFPPVFYVALLCSIGYSAYLLVSGYPDIKGGLYWVPVAVLSIINSVGEEFAFRHAIFEIFQNAGYSISVSNGIQGILYAVPHFIIGGASFGILAFFYGLLLGAVRVRAGSITPCIISHFFIDIGCIGLPMLSL